MAFFLSDALLGIIVGVIGVIVAIAVFTIQEREKRGALGRSTIALTREIYENKRTLEGGIYEPIVYRTCDRTVRYVNKLLSIAAYDSIIGSGYFTYYTADTQVT